MDVDIFGERREYRAEWAKYLQEANEIVQKNNKNSNIQQISPAIHKELIEGTFPISEIPHQKKVVRVFISSTFTDTEAERNLLMIDVFPYLTQLCRLFGLQFEVVDMRWGVREFTNDDHGTFNLCMSELHKCKRESLGPAFFCLLGDKYGFRPFPNKIERTELEEMWAKILPLELEKVDRILPQHASDIKQTASLHPLAKLWDSFDTTIRTELEAKDLMLIPRWFKLDKNNIPPLYILQIITSHIPEFRSDDKELRQAAGNRWWNIFEEISELLRKGSSVLGEAEQRKYFMSVTEAEVHNGILLNEKRDSQSFCCRRDISNALLFPSEIPTRGKFVDVNNNSVDATAHTMLSHLKTKAVPEVLNSSNISDYTVTPTLVASPTDTEIELKHKYLRDFSDMFCDKMVKSIFEGYRSKNVSLPSLDQELTQHYFFYETKSANLIDRPDVTKSVMAYLSSPQTTPHCIVGESGSGKTSIMALAATLIKEKYPKALVVYRFIGITPSSSSARPLVQSLYTQVNELLAKKNLQEDEDEDSGELVLPSDLNTLARDFASILRGATPGRPLFILLDSLDQLSNEDSGQLLRWLPWQLPENVHLLVSVLSSHKIYETIKCHKSMVPEKCFTFVNRITADNALPIMRGLLTAKDRLLTDAQQVIAEKAFLECPLPLYVKVASDIICKWPSYHPFENCRLEGDLPSLIAHSIFRNLELIHGEQLVTHALGLLTAAKDGLSCRELEDILSCTEEVLCDVYQWWRPPLRVLPPMLWKRIRDDLGGYLVERGSSGAVVYRWYHRQFWEAAERRYLKDEKGKKEDERGRQLSQREAAHLAIANYFDGKWSSPNKVPYIDEKGEKQESDRLIGKQPLQFSSTIFNLRKLSELPYHQTLSRATDGYNSTLFNFEFISAKCGAGLFNELIQDYQFALEHTDKADQPELLSRLTYFIEFVQKNLHILSRYPTQALQLAVNSPDVLKITEEAKIQATESGKQVIKWVNKNQTLDPCIKTLVYSDQITGFSISQDESVIALKNNRNGTIAVLNFHTGETITVLSLRTVNCHKLLGDGSKLLVGTATDLQVWDLISNELIFSLPLKASDCDASKDGKWVACAGAALTILDFEKRVVLTELREELSESGYSKSVFSPSGDIFATVANESGCVLLYTVPTFKLFGKLPGVSVSKNCPCTITFSENGKHLITTFTAAGLGKCVVWDHYTQTQLYTVSAAFGAFGGCLSSNEKHILVAANSLLKVYDVKTGENIGTYRHRGKTQVTMVQYIQGSKYIVSSSTDKTIKVWDASILLTANGDYKAEEGVVRGCGFSPNGETFAFASSVFEGVIKIAKKFGVKPAPRGAYNLLPQKIQIYTIVNTPHGILSSHKGVARLIDPSTGKIKQEYKCNGIIRANISPKGDLVACATSVSPNSVHLFDAKTGKEIITSGKSFGNYKYTTDCCAFSPDGTKLAVGGEYLSVINTTPPYEQIQLCDSLHAQFVECCAFSPDGSMLAAEAEVVKLTKMWKVSKGEVKHHHLCLWDVTSNTIKHMYEVRGTIKSIKFISETLLFVVDQNTIWLFDLLSRPLSPSLFFIRPSDFRFSCGDMYGNSIVAFDEDGYIYYFTIGN